MEKRYRYAQDQRLDLDGEHSPATDEISGDSVQDVFGDEKNAQVGTQWLRIQLNGA